MAKTKNVRHHEGPNPREAIYHFDPSLAYISLHSGHAVKMGRIKKNVRRQNTRLPNIDANIKTADTQVYNRPPKKKAGHLAHTSQDSGSPVYPGLLPSEIHPKSKAPAQDRSPKIHPVPAPMPPRTAAEFYSAPTPTPLVTEAPIKDSRKEFYSVPVSMPQRTEAPKDSREEPKLSINKNRHHVSSAPREKASAVLKGFTGRFDGISINLNTIALAASILAAVLFLFIGYVTISVFRDRNASGRDSRVLTESSVSSPDEELPEYCPRLTLITHSVTIKAGDHFSPLDYIGTMSDDTDTQETLSHNVMLIDYDKLDESKKGTYQLGYYILDSDENQSNIEYLDITVH